MSSKKHHIYIFSPSSAIREKALVRRGVKQLEALGYEVELDPGTFATHMRFAGDDATRLEGIHRAAASGADIALITRGGYGLTRLLPDIRYKQVAKAIHKGLRFVGHSDFTAFQNAVLAETGEVTWSGPALGEDFGHDGEVDEIMLACFQDMVEGTAEGTGWRLSTADAQLGPLEAGGVLWGGNLAIMAALAGSKWMPKVRNGILFLEDIHEHPYRIERMLTQLLYAGALDKQRAILLGHFTNYRPVPHDKGYRLQTVIDWLRTRVKCPVLTGLPFGHVRTKVSLPVGAKVHLVVEGREALLLWGHLGHAH